MESARCLAGEAVVPTDDPGATERLRALLAREGLFPETAGHRVVALIDPGGDPVRPILAALLGQQPMRMRWGIGAALEPDAARALALAALDDARAERRAIAIRVRPGLAAADLADRGAVLEALLAGTTTRQGEIARRILLDGRRQAEVAAELGVSRATISVAVARGHVAAIGAAHRLLVAGLAAPPIGPGAAAP